MYAFVEPCLGSFRATIPKPCTCSSAAANQLGKQKSSFQGRGLARCVPRTLPSLNTHIREVTQAVFGGGGILGVGPSEVAVIVAVGWLLLGPQKLFSLARDSGKLLGELRRTANDAKETFNEALDADLLAAELNLTSQASKEVEKEARKEVTEDATDEGSREELQGIAASDQDGEDGEVLGPPLQDALASVADSSSSQSEGFLDQLRRVSDPEQIAPSEVPDLSVDMEELEVERLEKEYIAAKMRLEARRRKSAPEGSSPVESATEDR